MQDTPTPPPPFRRSRVCEQTSRRRRPHQARALSCAAGSKSDLPNRCVSEETARDLAQRLKMIYVDTSAKTGENASKRSAMSRPRAEHTPARAPSSFSGSFDHTRSVRGNFTCEVLGEPGKFQLFWSA
eukprot:3432265-Pleurochrysis_carterae.AAC.2